MISTGIVIDWRLRDVAAGPNTGSIATTARMRGSRYDRSASARSGIESGLTPAMNEQSGVGRGPLQYARKSAGRMRAPASRRTVAPPPEWPIAAMRRGSVRRAEGGSPWGRAGTRRSPRGRPQQPRPQHAHGAETPRGRVAALDAHVPELVARMVAPRDDVAACGERLGEPGEVRRIAAAPVREQHQRQPARRGHGPRIPCAPT